MEILVMGLIQDGWLEFSSHVLPKKTPLIQREEMEKAWFGGAGFLMSLLTNMGEKSLSEDEIDEITSGLFKEMQSFSEYMKEKAELELLKKPVGNG